MAEPEELPTFPEQRPIVYGFSFEISMAGELRGSLESLRDSNFNSQGFALLEVEAHGILIMSVSDNTKVLGLLVFKPEALRHFQAHKPPYSMIIDLNQLAYHLHDAEADDILSFFHVQGSNKLMIMLGKETFQSFTLKLPEHKASFKSFPTVSDANTHEGDVESEELRKIIQSVKAEDNTSKALTFIFTDSDVSIQVGELKWQYKYLNQNAGESSKENSSVVEFEWLHCGSLEKASFLSKRVLLCLAADPTNCMKLKFEIQSDQYLVFIVGSDIDFPEIKAEKQETTSASGETGSSSAINQWISESGYEAGSSATESGEQGSRSETGRREKQTGSPIASLLKALSRSCFSPKSPRSDRDSNPDD